MALIDKDTLVAEIDKEIKCTYAGREYVGIPLDEANRVYGLEIAKGIIDNLEEINSIDVFIEKAEEWLRNNQRGFILTDKDITDFVNYMKVE